MSIILEAEKEVKEAVELSEMTDWNSEVWEARELDRRTVLDMGERFEMVVGGGGMIELLLVLLVVVEGGGIGDVGG